MTLERLAFLIVLAVVGAMWLFQGRQTSDAEAHAKEWQDTAQVRLDKLQATQRKADSVTQALELERSRTDAFVAQSRAREEELIQEANRARTARMEAGDDLKETILAIPDPVVRDTALAQFTRLTETYETELQARESVTDRVREQMEAVAALSAQKDTVIGALEERAQAAEEWGQAEAAQAAAWKRAFEEKQGSGLSIVDRILPEGRVRVIGKGILCVGAGEGTRRVTGNTEAGLALATGCLLGSLGF